MENLELKPELPHDFDAEIQLIGWVLADNKLLNHIFLTPEVFFEGFHAEIWGCILELGNKGQSISPYTIKPLMQENKENPSIIQYLAKCLTQSILMTKPIDGAKHLSELHQKRILISGLADISQDDDIETSIGKLNILSSSIANKATITQFDDCLVVSEAIMKDLRDKKKPRSTGLKKLDIAMDGGFYRGKSYGIAARKKVGKTALAATISENLNEDGAKHLFICGEMSPSEIHQRVLSRRADLYPSAFRAGYSESADFNNKLTQAITSQKRNTLYKNAPAVTFDALRQIFTVAVEKHKVEGIILDYWQLVGGKPKSKSTAEHLDEVAQFIADFGRTYNIWTLTFAQINQEGNTRGGEGIRLAFDQLYELHRENLAESYAWLEMMETRYTPWLNPYGDKDNPTLFMNERGPFYEEL